jgi:hypothetical protein
MWRLPPGLAPSAGMGILGAVIYVAEEPGVMFRPLVSTVSIVGRNDCGSYQSVPSVTGGFLAENLAQSVSHSLTRNLDCLDTPVEVRDFCAQKQIVHEVDKAIGLARTYLAMIGEPEFELVHDPDHDECYLGIHVCVSERPEILVRQGRSLLRALRSSIDRDKLNFINVIYHAV